MSNEWYSMLYSYSSRTGNLRWWGNYIETKEGRDLKLFILILMISFVNKVAIVL